MIDRTTPLPRLLVPLADLEQEALNCGLQFQHRPRVRLVFDTIEIARYLYITAHEEQNATAT